MSIGGIGVFRLTFATIVWISDSSALDKDSIETSRESFEKSKSSISNLAIEILKMIGEEELRLMK